MDAILGLFNNPMVLAVIGVGWGIVCKYWPFMVRVPNMLIPWVTAFGVFLVKLASPAAVHAQALADSVGVDTMIVNPLAAVSVPTQGVMEAAVAGGWQAIVCALLYETFLRPWFEKKGWAKPAEPKAKRSH